MLTAASTRNPLRDASSEDWARFEGHALGRVLDEDAPTAPDLPIVVASDDDVTTDRVFPETLPGWARDALVHEALGLGPLDSPNDDGGAFAPADTVLITSELLEQLLGAEGLP